MYKFRNMNAQKTLLKNIYEYVEGYPFDLDSWSELKINEEIEFEKTNFIVTYLREITKLKNMMDSLIIEEIKTSGPKVYYDNYDELQIILFTHGKLKRYNFPEFTVRVGTVDIKESYLIDIWNLDINLVDDDLLYIIYAVPQDYGRERFRISISKNEASIIKKKLIIADKKLTDEYYADKKLMDEYFGEFDD